MPQRHRPPPACAQAKRALRLRLLTADSRLAPSHARRAAQLLLDHAEALAQQLEGAEVHIGFSNRVDEGRGAAVGGHGAPRLEIAWDCEL